MFEALRFIVLAESSLPIFQSVLFEGCSLHVAVFERALVLTTARVCGRDDSRKTFRQVV